ncbi:1-phosphofructokinase [Alkalicoccus luteus]|uniref:1-phosphofructokinase n=1 Tax=Alkalicoccus luteus TaxID=1237094 RepID=UPI0040347CF7
MIYTVTLNPSIDCFMELPELVEGATNRATEQRMIPGGKGINVSRVLHRFGIASTLLGFTAGFTGAFLKEELAAEGLRTHFTDTPGMTRINMKLKTAKETEVNGPSQAISEEHVHQLLAGLDSADEHDLLVLSGSLPPSLPSETYRMIAEKLTLRTVIDTSGVPLQKALSARPYLIKPNIDELTALYGQESADTPGAVRLAKKAVADGAKNVLVSRGAESALLVSAERVLEAAVPTGTIHSTVGAGDSMVAGFLAGLENGLAPEEAFRWSIAAGSATAFSESLCTKEHVEDLLPSVSVHEYKEESV